MDLKVVLIFMVHMVPSLYSSRWGWGDTKEVAFRVR